MYKCEGLGPRVNCRDYCPPPRFVTNIFKYTKTNISLSDENNKNKLTVHSSKTKYVVHN